jgi:hypothetical protein
MQTLTIQITSDNGLKALHALEEKHHIKIVDDANLDSPALPGAQMSLKAFKDWIAKSEEAPTVSLQEAKSKWAEKRKQLQKLIR